MGEVGNWGSTITFTVSSDEVLTFSGFQRNVSSRWKDHGIINSKPRSEYTGAGLSTISMNVLLSAADGVNPRETIELLEAAAEQGMVDYIFVGGKKVGTNKMRLDSMSETWDRIIDHGRLAMATLNLSFSEYVDDGNAVSDLEGAETNVPWEFKVKDKVEFTSGIYWTKPTKKGKKKKAKPGPAKITKYQKKKKHPWKIKTTNKKKTKVNGWVNDGDFKVWT